MFVRFVIRFKNGLCCVIIGSGGGLVVESIMSVEKPWMGYRILRASRTMCIE